MPRGRRSETLLSICSRSKVCPTTRSTDRQAALAYAGPIYCTMGKVREWELSSLFFSTSLCQRGSSPETLGQFVWSKQKSRTRGEKQQSPEWYFRLTHSLTYCQIPPHTLFHSDAPFWLILTDWFRFGWPFVVPSAPASSSFPLLGSGDHISYCIPTTLIVIPLLSEGKTPEADRRQSTIHPQDPGETNSPGQNLSFYL